MPCRIMISESVVTVSKLIHPRASRGGRGKGRWPCAQLPLRLPAGGRRLLSRHWQAQLRGWAHGGGFGRWRRDDKSRLRFVRVKAQHFR